MKVIDNYVTDYGAGIKRLYIDPSYLASIAVNKLRRVHIFGF